MANVKVQNKQTGQILVIPIELFDSEKHISVMCPCEEPLTVIEAAKPVEKPTVAIAATVESPVAKARYDALFAKGWKNLNKEERVEYKLLKAQYDSSAAQSD